MGAVDSDGDETTASDGACMLREAVVALLAEELLDLGDQVVAGRPARLVDHRLQALDVGPRVGVGGRRGVEAGKDCISPNSHTAFSDPRSLIGFVEEIAKTTGFPVGIKSAVGQSLNADEVQQRLSGLVVPRRGNAQLEAEFRCRKDP